jgi:phosphomannomutase
VTIAEGIFKAYDVRGLYPDEIDADVAARIGAALVEQLGASTVAVGRDPRLSSPELAAAFVSGAIAAGARVVDFGMVATEMLYYGVADRGLDGGAMVTASHNPRQYNGMKLVGEGALPLSGDAGIPDLERLVRSMSDTPVGDTDLASACEAVDLYPAYVKHLLTFAEPSSWPDYRVVMDACNGIAGKLAPLVFENTPVRRTELLFEVDGSFPQHAPNPLLEENRALLASHVRDEKADLGIAWDGDADRCFFIDEQGEFVPGDFVTALLAQALLVRHPGAAILYDLRASRAVPDTIRENGGVPLINRVGHAFFKQRMRREPVLFGGEVSGHYYFTENYNADSGFIPALLMLDLLARQKATMSELLEPLRSRYFISGEINSTVRDAAEVFRKIKQRFSDATVTELDGISIDYEHWHCNVRASNTEPLVRLNLGADSQGLMEERRDLVLGIIRED